MTDPAVSVVLEDDPTPLVLTVGRTLRAGTRDPESRGLLASLRETVVIRSKDDPQSVTIRFDEDRVRVSHGIASDAHLVLTVDLADRFAVESVDGAEPDAPFVSDVLRVLRPPLPHWRDAASRFWEMTSLDPGMPRELVVVCEEEELVLGGGLPRYVLCGEAEKLARVLSGTDVFLDEVYTGSLAVRGTMTQLSVMAGASLKVRFHA
ncbi:SCP2 sterol-binding domain-containing protein [Streptomyces sp. NPDC000878]